MDLFSAIEMRTIGRPESVQNPVPRKSPADKAVFLDG